MHFVWAAAHKPPKDTQAIQKRKDMGTGRALWHNSATPLVISREGRKIQVNRMPEQGIFWARDRKMEKSMM